MRIVKKNVYYCDFCKKRGLRSLAEHEKHCTGNPNRECRMTSCGRGPEGLAEIKNKYQAMFTVEEKRGTDNITGQTYEWSQKTSTYSIPFTWKDISTDVGGCPACTLAVMRQLGLLNYWHDEVHKEYDLKKHFKEYWNEENENRRDRDGGY